MNSQENLRLRSTLRVEFVGQAEPFLQRARVPTNAEVLKAVFYEHLVKKVAIPIAVRQLSEVVCGLDVPAVRVAPAYFVKRRILSLYNEWKGLMKHKSRKTDGAQLKRDKFLQTLPKELDCVEARNETEEETMDQEQSDDDVRIERKRKVNLVTPNVAMALDRAGISNREASLIFGALAEDNHLGDAVEPSSYSSIRRERMKIREEFAMQIKDEFSPDVPLTLHWDGKLLPNIEGKKVDRLAIVVTGANVSKLLAGPSVENGKAEVEAEAILDTLDAWGLRERVVAMSFDTTNVNAGIHNGIITRLPRLLDRPLLGLACRHHVSELVLKHAFELESRSSKSDQLDDFKIFKTAYNTNHFYLNPPSFRTVLDSESTRNIANPWRPLIIDFCTSQLESQQIRCDYMELLELSIIFLGEAPPKGIKFRRAGSLSRARWMGRAIYTLKAWMFQDTIKLFEADQIQHLETMCFFITQCYVTYWYQVGKASAAPRLDLQFWKQMDEFHDKKYADVGKKALCNHLWYLSQRNVSLALFDPEVPDTEKAQMVNKMLSTPTKKSRSDLFTIPPKADAITDTSTLESFVTPESLNFFKIMEINTDFLQKSPDLWPHDSNYRQAQERITALQVVNDVAERAVKLISDFNQKLTRDPVQQQYLLQVVEFHRQQHPLR